MQNEPIDIIVPVWNRPVETRACLVSLIENSGSIRLILVDNSCDRETEGILGEFAEALDVKALFLKNRLNEGFVKALNRGLNRTESRYVAIVRQDSIVRPGWLDSLHRLMKEIPDAGIAVPAYSDKGSKTPPKAGKAVFRGMEIYYADFAGFLMRRSLLDELGYFNEEMDGGSWCLKEYSRRAWKAGYRTCTSPDATLERSEELNMGSSTRRAEHEQLVRAQFKESWGEESAFSIYLPKGSDLGCMNARLSLIAAAARQGHRVMMVAHPAIAAELFKAGFNRIHEHISIIPFSRLIPVRSAKKAVSDFSGHGLPLTHICWEDNASFPGESESIRFSEFEQLVIDYEQKYYQRDIENQVSEAADEKRNSQPAC